MIKFNTFTELIRIQVPTCSTDDYGFPIDDWDDLINEDITCEWKNKYGVESWKVNTIQAREPASIKLWFMENITPQCRVVRVSDAAIFEIINVDDVMNRHLQLELEVRRYTKG
jgi:head-tail adaptor